MSSVGDASQKVLSLFDGNMTGELYRDILDNNLLKSAKKLRMNHQWVFQQDNDPKHTAGIVTNWLNRNHVERRMKKEQPRNVKDLKECLTRVWEGIETAVLKKLVDSVPNRLNEVISTKGYPTRY